MRKRGVAMPRAGRFAGLLDKFLLLVALAIFLAVGQSILREPSENIWPRQGVVSGRSSDLQAEEAEALERSALAVAAPPAWKQPTSQSRGKEWVFDLFTPPVIYYDAQAQAFVVTPPTASDAKRVVESDDGGPLLELVELRRSPYRLQLVGYAGEEGGYLAYLEYGPTGEIILAREGQDVPQAGVRVLAIEVRQELLESEASMPVVEEVGVARLDDYANNREVSLTNRETKVFSEMEAVLRDGRTGERYRGRVGERIAFGAGEAFVIESISPELGQASVTLFDSPEALASPRILKLVVAERREKASNPEPSRFAPFSKP